MLDYLRSTLLAVPEIAGWPAIATVVERLKQVTPMSSLEHPLIAARALGADPRVAWPGAAVIYCLQAGIHLVDDMLDEDPDGLYRTLGNGATANVALALQAAGLRIAATCEIDAGRRVEILRRLTGVCLATAHGQALDLEAALDEAAYWRIVETKSPPLFGAALMIGAALAGGGDDAIEGCDRLGQAIGMIIQLHDDLGDAMDTVAQPDWQRPGANLALLFALTADHPDRDRFHRLRRQIAASDPADVDPAVLEAAHTILVRSGAVSYCFYQLVGRCEQARDLLDQLDLPHRQHLAALLSQYVKPLVALFEHNEIEVPAAISKLAAA